MEQRFVGRAAVIIGGNSGIGLATAKAFAAEGARVVITGRDTDTLRMAVQEIGHGAVAHRSDIADLGQIDALFARLGSDLGGRIDVLFVNAGVGAFLPIEAVTEADCHTPMRRMGAPEEVAAAVLFLASDGAGFVTGIDFLVDGGAASF